MAIRAKKIESLHQIIQWLMDSFYSALPSKNASAEVVEQQKHIGNITGCIMYCNQQPTSDINLLKTIQIELHHYIEELEREEFLEDLHAEQEKEKQAFLDAIAANADIKEKKVLERMMKEFYERIDELEKKLTEAWQKSRELRETITLFQLRIIQFEEKISMLNTESYQISIRMLSPASTDTSTQFTFSDQSGKSFSFEVRDEAVKKCTSEIIMLKESRGERISAQTLVAAVNDAVIIERKKEKMKVMKENNIQDTENTVIEQPNHQEIQQEIVNRIVNKKVLIKVAANNQEQDFCREKIARLKKYQAECAKKLAVVEKRIDIIQQEIKEVKNDKKRSVYKEKSSHFSLPDEPDSENPDNNNRSPRMGRK